MKKTLFYLSLTWTVLLQAQFSEETIFESCESCHFKKIIEIDFDFDGDEDLILGSTYKNNFVWFENLGEGKYASAKTLFSGIDGMLDFVLADFDEDQDIDIVYSVHHPFIEVERGLFFIERQENSFQSPEKLSEKFSYRLELGDLDADGDDDLLAYSNYFYSQGYEIASFENLLGNAFGEKKVITPLQRDYHPATSADFNADGFQDFLFVPDETQSIIFGQSGNSFSDPVNLEALLPIGVSRTIGKLSPIDFNQDGYIDVIQEISGRLNWYENVGGNNFEPNTTLLSDFPHSPNWSFYDYDKDGLKDILSSDWNGLVWSKNLGNMAFAPLDTLYQSNESLSQIIQSHKADGQKTESLYFYNSNQETIKQLSFEQLEQKKIGKLKERKGPLDLQIADFDSDGNNDFIALFNNTNEVAYFRNEGKDSFKEKIMSQEIYSYPRKLVVGDLDNDLDQDFIILNESGNSVKITSFLNDGNAHFTQKASVLESYDSKQTALVDMDNDGILELAIPSQTGVKFFKNKGDGTFTSLSVLSLGTYFEEVQFKDINGDKLPEVLVLTKTFSVENPTEFVIFYNQGNYEFEKFEAIGTLDTYSERMQLADLNQDGLEDFVYAFNNQIVWYPSLGESAFGAPVFLSPTLGRLSQIFTEDLDQDGDVDIIVSSYWTGLTHFFKNDGLGNFEEPKTLIENENSFVLKLGYLDQNNTLDLLSGFYNHGKITLFKNKLLYDFPISDLEEIVVSPNPTDSKVYIGGLQEGNFAIFDLKGRLINKGIFKDCGPIELMTLPSGVYLLEIFTEQEKVFKKIVKQ